MCKVLNWKSFRPIAKIDALNGEANSLDKDLTEREGTVAADKLALDALKKSYREFELLSQETVDLITKSNEKLRVVKTNKEYQSILKEIEETRKRKSEIEDRMLELLEQIEAEEAAVKDKEENLSRFAESCRRTELPLPQKVRMKKKSLPR
jgi:predicted  nucleic acid-binding Zn-ribbon protein